jgi:hypothetical protein
VKGITVKRLLLATILASSAAGVGGGGVAHAAPPASAAPTCSPTLGITVHGQHIVADYVTGIGHMAFDWPPSGGIVGETVSANGGVTIAGGPGPGFHFPNGFAPGASFCNDSNSPGLHL